MSKALSTEARGFKLVVFGVSAATAGVTFANIIYYNRLRKDPGALTKNTATTMMWVNIALFVISLLVMIWAVWALLFSKEKREEQLRFVTLKAGEGLAATKTYLGQEAPLLPQQSPIIVATAAVPQAAPSMAVAVGPAPAGPPAVTIVKRQS